MNKNKSKKYYTKKSIKNKKTKKRYQYKKKSRCRKKNKNTQYTKKIRKGGTENAIPKNTMTNIKENATTIENPNESKLGDKLVTLYNEYDDFRNSLNKLDWKDMTDEEKQKAEELFAKYTNILQEEVSDAGQATIHELEAELPKIGDIMAKNAPKLATDAIIEVPFLGAIVNLFRLSNDATNVGKEAVSELDQLVHISKHFVDEVNAKAQKINIDDIDNNTNTIQKTIPNTKQTTIPKPTIPKPTIPNQ